MYTLRAFLAVFHAYQGDWNFPRANFLDELCGAEM